MKLKVIIISIPTTLSVKLSYYTVKERKSRKVPRFGSENSWCIKGNTWLFPKLTFLTYLIIFISMVHTIFIVRSCFIYTLTQIIWTTLCVCWFSTCPICVFMNCVLIAVFNDSFKLNDCFNNLLGLSIETCSLCLKSVLKLLVVLLLFGLITIESRAKNKAYRNPCWEVFEV